MKMDCVDGFGLINFNVMRGCTNVVLFRMAFGKI